MAENKVVLGSLSAGLGTSSSASSTAVAVLAGSVATAVGLTTSASILSAVTGRGVATSGSLLVTRLDRDVLTIDDSRSAGDGGLVSFECLILDKGAILLAVDIKVAQFAVSSKGSAQFSFLDLLGDVLDVSHGTVLISSVAGSLSSLLALGISASSLPSRRLLGSSFSSKSWRSGGSGSNSSRSSSRGSSRSRSTALIGGRRRGSLGQRYDRARSSSSSGTASPSHGLGRSGGLSWGFSLSNRRRSRGLGLLGLLLLLSDLSSSGLDGSRSVFGSLLGSLSLLGLLCLDTVGSGGRALSNSRNSGDLLVGNRSNYRLGDLDRLLSGNLRRLVCGGLLLRRLVVVVLVVIFFVNVSPDIVQNEVTRGLLGQNEGLGKLSRLGAFVRCLTNDLDDNALERGLGVDVGDTDFAVLEVQFLDTVLDSLCKAN